MTSPAQDGEEALATPFLSFCIPTLNRATEIAESLESIARQATADLEVVIVDGGSTDDTAEVVESFRSRLPRLRLVSSETRSGVDRDILQSVEVARGTWCWLFSDDDVLEEGAVAKVLDALRSSPGIVGLSTNYRAYDPTMRFRVATVPAVARNAIRRTTRFSDAGECFSYLGIHLGFISCQVVRRDEWVAVARSEHLADQCNAWIIVYMIGRMLLAHPDWLYLEEVCVRYRSGNDSFIARVGVLRRQQITHVHFAHTLASLFGDGSPTYRKVFGTLLRDRMPRSLAVLKARGLDARTQVELFRLYLSRYRHYPDFWVRLVPIFLVPSILLRALKLAYMWRSRTALIRD